MLICLAFISAQAQVPQGFNYQAVARTGTGAPITGTALQVKASILSDTITPVILWEELHPKVATNASGVFNLVIGRGTRQAGSAAAFTDINWAVSALFLKIQIYYQGVWKYMGTSRLWSTPYSMVSNVAKSVESPSKLSVVSADDAGTDALFEVKRNDGQTVFAVYPDAVNIYVPRTEKGAKGGFAVGGFDAGKLAPQDYFRVTPDSVRIYIDSAPSQAKGAKGGFGVGGYGTGKGINNMYFNLTGATSVNTVVSSPQVLWYPNKNAFLAGNVHIGSVDSVGDYSTALGYQSIAMGDYSQAFGYKAKSLGDYSTSIGKNSVAGSNLPVANNAFALGDAAKATGSDSYAFGSGAVASGLRAFAFGSIGLDDSQTPLTGMPTRATGNYSVALGMGAYAFNIGAMALGVGANAGGVSSSTLGYYSTASNSYSTAIGYKTTASGINSVSIGSSSQATAQNSAAFGSSAQATNTNALALGNGSIASGTNSTAMGYQSQSQGDKSIAIGSFYSYSYSIPILTLGKGEETETGKGFDDLLPIRPLLPVTSLLRNFSRANIAQGQYSVAIGNGNLAQDGGLVFGSNSDATKFGALALGTSATAKGTNSIAMGYNTNSKGYYAAAIGNNVFANSYGEFALGQFNDTLSGNPTSWNENDLLLTVGNGLNSTNKSNALTIYKNGKTIIRGRYAVSTFNYKGLKLISLFPLNIKDVVYGMYTNLSRDDAAIEYYYSGYFGSTGASGVYYGLYADTRTGGAIDVAEYIYDTQANTEPADVVVADAANKESVVKSSKPYQTSVVGVISTKPHMTMGMELVVDEKTGEPLKNAKSATRLALTGRVPVKVTGENGAIVPGDLLTTSSTPGHAMKWTLLDISKAKDFDEMKTILAENERRRNAVIGKAVESFSGSGTGKVVVLVSLQ